MASKERRFMRVTVANMPPYAMTTPSSRPFEFSGPMREILDLLSTNLNFSYEIVPKSAQKIGNKSPNGSWDGMIGLLTKNKADIGAGPFMINAERFSDLFYTPPVMTQDITILAAKPKLDSTTAVRQFSYLSPFEVEVWLAIFFTLLILIIMYFFFDIVESKLGIGQEHRHHLQMFFRYLLNFFGGLINQGFDFEESTYGKRVLLSIFWFLALMFMIWFNCSVSANLVLTQDTEIIKSVKDLADLDDILPLIISGTAVAELFMHSEQPSFQKVWSRIKEHGLNNSILPAYIIYNNETLTKVLDRHAAIIAGRVSSEFKAMHKCSADLHGEFYFAESSFYPHYIAMAGRKTLDEYLKKGIVDCMNRLIQGGIIHEMFEKEKRKLPYCYHEDIEARFESLSLSTVKEAFFFLTGGCGLSIIAFFGELAMTGKCSFRKSVRKRTRQKKIAAVHSQSLSPLKRRKRTYDHHRMSVSGSRIIYDMYYMHCAKELEFRQQVTYY